MDDASNGYLVVVRLACILSASANQRTGRHPGQGRSHFPTSAKSLTRKGQDDESAARALDLGIEGNSDGTGKVGCDRL